jgi:hypothetical protein
MGTCSKLFGSVGFAAPFCLLKGGDSFSGEETRAIGGRNGGLSDGVRGLSGALLPSAFLDV